MMSSFRTIWNFFFFFFFNWFQFWSTAWWNAQMQYTGWPITWFTAVQQSNSVDGVVRRFSIQLPLKARRPVSVICPTHSSGRLFCIWIAVWIKPLSRECALEWKWRYGGLVWWVGQQRLWLWMTGWLIESKQGTLSTPVISTRPRT